MNARALGRVEPPADRRRCALAVDRPGNDERVVQSPRAFAYRSHSGFYGIVNSEEGYQNLTRFPFGSVRVDGILDIADVTLPDEIEADKKGNRVRAS